MNLGFRRRGDRSHDKPVGRAATTVFLRFQVKYSEVNVVVSRVTRAMSNMCVMRDSFVQKAWVEASASAWKREGDAERAREEKSIFSQ